LANTAAIPNMDAEIRHNPTPGPARRGDTEAGSKTLEAPRATSLVLTG